MAIRLCRYILSYYRLNTTSKYSIIPWLATNHNGKQPFIPIAHIRKDLLLLSSCNPRLSSLLHVPKLSYNLLFVHKLVHV